MPGASGRNNPLRCSKCGTLLVGTAFREIDGKKYCEACYQSLMAEKIAFDNAQKDLYNYIKEIFGVTYIPPEVIGAITRQISYDKVQIKGLKATIWYYYKVLGNNPVLELLPRVLKEQYDRTRQYLIDQKKIREENMKVNINVKPRIVVVNKDDKENRNKPKYKMEDL